MPSVVKSFQEFVESRIKKYVNAEILLSLYNKTHAKIIEELGCKVVEIPFKIAESTDYKSFALINKDNGIGNLYKYHMFSEYLKEFKITEEEFFCAKLIEGFRPAKHFLGWYKKKLKGDKKVMPPNLAKDANEAVATCSILFARLAEWKSPDFSGTIHVSFDIEDILNLGHNASLDSESCFKYNGMNDYLKANIACVYNSFVVIMINSDGIATDRMFGWIDKNRKYILFSNAYGVSSNSKRLKIMQEICTYFKIEPNQNQSLNDTYHNLRNEISNRVFINDNFPIIFMNKNIGISDVDFQFEKDNSGKLFC